MRGIRREESGIYNNPNTKINYKIVRSISLSEDGKLNNSDMLDEIFKGVKTFKNNNKTFKNSNKTIELFGHPSTIIIDDKSVIIASQVYELLFSENKSLYNNIKTYSNYFNKRKNIIQSNKKIGITWLGSISIVYSYKDRNMFTKYFNSPITNLFFWITSFNSSKCITAFLNKNEKETNENKISKYCNKYKSLKKFCKDQSKYQIHNTYSYLLEDNIGKKSYKFLTNFNDALDKICKEDDALKIYNTYNETNYFQRYNETFTYFFPWDIEGIEVGNRKNEEIIDLLNNINLCKKETIKNLNNINNDSNKISIINMIINKILISDINGINNDINNEKKYTYTYFLLSKFLLLSECNFIVRKNIINNNLINNSIKDIILIIINLLNKDLIIYEYTLQTNNTFKIIEIGKYTIENKLIGKLNRNNKFILFEQKKNLGNNITQVSISDKQLNLYNNE